MLGRAAPDLAVALARRIAISLAVIDHDLLQELADLLRRMVRFEFKHLFRI